MRRAIIFTLLLLLPTILHAGVVKWDGKPIPITISTERLTRIEFPETPGARAGRDPSVGSAEMSRMCDRTYVVHH